MAKEARRFGNINTTPGLRDEKIRQVPLVWRKQNGAIATLGLEALRGAISFGMLTAFRSLVTDREKPMIRNSFSQYLAPSILTDIENQGFHISLGGQMRELAVIFSDIRNFTPLTGSMPADALVSLLNDLFTDLSQEVLDNEGTIDKFIGDSIIAFWNAPLTLEDHTRQAAIAALGMRDELETYVAKRPDAQRKIEIGLHAGEACVGNIGSRQRFNYSAIDKAVRPHHG